MEQTRREFCRRAAGVATAGALGAAAIDGAAAANLPQYSPTNVATADFPEELLREYQPALASSESARSKLIGIYAWRATPADDSPVETEALYYWFKYSHQTGFFSNLIRGGVSRAHLGDIEPVIVFRDPASGDVNRVVCSGYHHFAAERSGDELSLLDGTHPRLRLIDPWHHYNFLDDGEDTAGLLGPSAGLNDWLSVRNAWYRDGIYNHTAVSAVDDPYTMLDRDFWWSDGTQEQQLYGLWLQLPFDLNFLSAIASPARASDDLRVLQ